VSDWYRLLLILIVFAVQHFLSTRNNVYWGGLLPIIYIATLISVQFYGIFEWSMMQFILFAIVGELFLVGYWMSGRKILASKRQRELEKMKAFDL